MGKATREDKTIFLLATILAETSPQAVPLGAACTASALKAAFPQAAVKLAAVSFEDAKDKKVSAEELLASLLREKITATAAEKNGPKAFFIGFSVYLWNAIACAKTAQLLRETFSQTAAGAPKDGGADFFSSITFFAGGPSADTVIPGFTYDFVFSGEGENLPAFLKEAGYIAAAARQTSAPPADAPPATRHNGTAFPSPWLDGTLAPADYNGVLWELARGCPYRCTYCSESCESRDAKKRHEFPLERLERELDFFVSVRVPQVYVLEPAFTANRDRALKLIGLMAEKLPDAHFQIEARAEQIDAPLAKAFTRLVCSLQIGLQSANPAVLKNVGRAFDRKQFSRKIALLNEFGVVFGLDLIYGLPGDTLPSFRDSLDYAISLYPNHLDIFRLAVLPHTRLKEQAAEFGLQYDELPPHHVRCTPSFSRSDLAKAEELAFACTLFYSAGRAVSWFQAVLKPLKIRSAQFFADFAEWTRCYNCDLHTGFDPYLAPHTEIERMQLAFLKLKYAEKKADFMFRAVSDTVRLNGAFARAVGEGEETILDLAYYPEDVLEAPSGDLAYFAEEACMEAHRVRVFAGSDGPDMEVL